MKSCSKDDSKEIRNKRSIKN